MTMSLKVLSIIWKILIISLLTIWASGCSSDNLDSGKAATEMIPDEQSDSVRIVTMNGEVITMEMHARHIDRFYKRKETFIDSLYLENYNREGDLESTLTCKSAKIDEARNIVVCYDDVVVISPNGRLETPQLTWNRATGLVLAEKGVILKRGDDTLWGERMRTDMKLDNIEIVKVSAEGNIKNSGLEW
jgi:LPS export ABC transporter protein LptC